jgi:hypothetical protein
VNGLKLKSAVALLVLVHLVAHLGAHAWPVLLTPPDATQVSAGAGEVPADAGGVPICPACLAQRMEPAAPLLSFSLIASQPVAPPFETPLSLSIVLVRSARAPPLA